jgi:hypothetical protein
MAPPKTLYAQTVIEAPGPGAQKVYQRGQEVPNDLDGIDELLDAGAVGPEPPETDVTTSDGASVGEAAG